MILQLLINYLLKRAPSGQDPSLRGNVILSTTFFWQNIIKFVYEMNNTFVTWNTHKFKKH